MVSHEMGHNFGLYHLHSMDCGTVVLGPNCPTSDYGGTLDAMGNPSSGHFNGFQKQRLGWLDYGNSPPITTVQGNGVYALNPFADDGSGALKIVKSTDPTPGKKTWYYVEYRQAFGFDGFLSRNSNVTNGVVIHTGSEASGKGASASATLTVTSSTTAPNSFHGIWVTTTDHADPACFATTSVSVHLVASLAVTVATNKASYPRNQRVIMTATVTESGSPVANVAVTFTITKPNGTVVKGTATTGTNGTTVFNYPIKKNHLLGLYTVTAATSLNGVIAKAATSFTVQ